MPGLIQPLFEGPVDLVGDIHGEFEALQGLLQRLGYDAQGVHPEGRRLVFLGDIVDRGPDSPAVVRLVQEFVESGVAQCVLGNHESNLVDGEHKEGNHWFFGEDENIAGKGSPHFPSQLLLNDTEREHMVDFFRRLPLALEREDLRVVHACWNDKLIDEARGSTREALIANEGVGPEHHDGEARQAALILSGQLMTERNPPPFDDKIANYVEALQMSNPLRVLISGPERVLDTKQPVFKGGKWRFVQRDNWWERYDATPVVVGHYWRKRCTTKDTNSDWWGLGKVYCVDFSVGRRYAERARGRAHGFNGVLGALRWPEREVVFDDDASNAAPS